MNKKKIITTASAVALAAMLAFGGTLAYYQGQAESPVENTLVDQGNSVTISETDEDGNITYSNTYSIIPGTTDKKDPVVTAEYTLDSYVYVTVDDTTGDLITWEAASAWTKLDGYDNVYYLLLKTAPLYSDWGGSSSYTDADTGYVYTYTDSETYAVKDSSGNVLYTYTAETAGSTTLYTAKIPVIDGDTITYSSEITNETFEGYGSTVSLDFTAYIIQAWLGGDESYGESSESYATPAEAYAVALGAPYVAGASYEFLEADDETSIPEALANAVSDANKNEEGTTVIVLPEADEDTEDVELGSKLSVTGDMVIDLNGNNLTLDGDANDTRVVEASEGATLTLTNGSVDTDKSYGVTAYSSSSVSLENMDVSAATYALYVDDANLEATDCTLTAENSRAVLVTTYYESQGDDSTASCEVTLTNCEITATGSNYAAGVQSQGANITLTIDSCDITSNYYGVYQNGAYSPVTIKIVDTTITDTESGGVYVSNSSTTGREKQTLIIENSTITGPTAVEFKHTDATITNSTLNATVDPATSGENGNGSCTNGYSLACTTNSATDYVTGTVVVTDCDMYLVLDSGTSEGHYFVYQVAEGDGNSVTIDGTAVSNYDSYGDSTAAD